MGGSGPILRPRVRAVAVRRNPRKKEKKNEERREIQRFRERKIGNGNTTNLEKGNGLWSLQLLAKRAVAASGLGWTGLLVNVHLIRQAIQPPIVSSSPNGVIISPLHSILIADGPVMSANDKDEDGFI